MNQIVNVRDLRQYMYVHALCSQPILQLLV